MEHFPDREKHQVVSFLTSVTKQSEIVFISAPNSTRFNCKWLGQRKGNLMLLPQPVYEEDAPRTIRRLQRCRPWLNDTRKRNLHKSTPPTSSPPPFPRPSPFLTHHSLFWVLKSNQLRTWSNSDIAIEHFS